MTREEQLVLTAIWRNGGYNATYDRFMLSSSVVLRLKFSAKKSPPSPSLEPLAASVLRQRHNSK